ncbi:hypothetical protein L1049_020324 [Liquidambar formosana]|uniref:Uncharacterized protein n=1 Tax=Liquidambar formosana TaxID=63359 RepID=A0AAP0X9S2_LIQFO
MRKARRAIMIHHDHSFSCFCRINKGSKLKPSSNEKSSKSKDVENPSITHREWTKPTSPFMCDFPPHHKARISSQMDLTHSFKSLDQNFKHQPLESTLSTQNWNKVLMMQFKQPPNKELKPYPLLEDDHSPLLFSSSKHHFQVNLQNSAPSTNLRTFFQVCNNSSSVNIRPLNTQCKSNDDIIEFPTGCTINSIPLATGSHIKNQEAFETASTVTLGMKNHMVAQNCINNWEPMREKSTAGEQALLSSLEENSQSCLLQRDGCT